VSSAETCGAIESREKILPEYQDTVFAALYDYADMRARACDREIILPKDAFVLATRQHPNCVDSSKFERMDNRTYIFAVFWSLLNRVPDSTALASWETISRKMPSPKFRKKLMHRLSHSMEARTKRVRSVPFSTGELEHIDCFAKSGNGKNTASFYLHSLWFYVIDRIVYFLYNVYRHTLRPIRIYLRDRIRNKRNSIKGGKT